MFVKLKLTEIQAKLDQNVGVGRQCIICGQKVMSTLLESHVLTFVNWDKIAVINHLFKCHPCHLTIDIFMAWINSF